MIEMTHDTGNNKLYLSLSLMLAIMTYHCTLPFLRWFTISNHFQFLRCFSVIASQYMTGA